jgi:hypothetical protein
VEGPPIKQKTTATIRKKKKEPNGKWDFSGVITRGRNELPPRLVSWFTSKCLGCFVYKLSQEEKEEKLPNVYVCPVILSRF